MRAFFRIFRNRWLITLLGFMALAVLVWMVGPEIAIAGKVPLQSPMARLGFFLFFVFIWALNLLWTLVKVNKANTQLAQGIGDIEDPHASAQELRSREEVESLKKRFEEALQVLKKTSQGKGHPNIYELPWYIIIGPPGSGKTTALVNSGLNFPLAEKYGSAALQGVGGTRNCDWWFTDEAVLLDTAGRYTTQDSDSEADKAAWNGFLQLLIRHRKRRPINGALVAISVSDLLTQSPAERSAQVSSIKHRLQELNTELKTSFPVYVLFTKSDLVPGFTEFFDDLGREDRGQVWGMTFPYTGAAEADVIEHFGAEFDALVDRLNIRVVSRMEQERDMERRARIFSFPQQFDALKPMLGEFLEQIFQGNRYQKDTMLRGIYFTSGTQEGAPIDRVLASLSRTLGVSSQIPGQAGGQGRSYFVTRLFKDLVFSEAGLAGANKRLEIQRFWLQRAAYAGAVIITGLAALAWTTSYTRNQVYVNRAGSVLEEYESVATQGTPATPDFTNILETLNASRAVAEVYKPFREDVPLLMGMGLYQGRRINRAADEAYERELQRLLLPSVAARLEQHLVIGEKDPDFQYHALKTYLMLGDASQLDNEVVQGWMDLDWGVNYQRQPEIHGQLQQHLQAMLAFGVDPIELDATLVGSARNSLERQSVAELRYGMIKRDYIATDTKPLLLVDLYGNSGSKVFRHVSTDAGDQRIPSLFTYAGYHEYFSEQLDGFVEQAEREAWVLEDEPRVLSSPEKKQIRKDLRELYFVDYVRTWEGMLGKLRVVPFSNLSQAASVLNLASSAASPVQRALEVSAHNTTLAGSELLAKAGALGGQASSKNRLGDLFKTITDLGDAAEVKLPEHLVDDRFAELNELTRVNEAGALPLDPVLSLLSRLYGELDAVSAGRGQDAVSLAKAADSSDVLSLLKREAQGQPEPLRTWLLQFVRNSRSVILATAREQINQDWQALVYPECQTALNGRYPFTPGAEKEVALADFGRIFGPNGLIDVFYNDQLKPFTEVRQGRRQWKNLDGMEIGMPDEVLRLFQHAASIKKLFFQGGNSTPAIAFRMKPVYLDANVDANNLDLEGQNFNYRHGPQFLQNARWPDPDGTGRVRLEFIDDSGNRLVRNYEGPWAWFRLLGDSELSSKTGDIALVTFVHRGRRASWELHAQSVDNPFLLGKFGQFYCPERL